MPTPDAPVACLECKERFATKRGLCERCYGRLAGLVRAGKAAWQELERAGRVKSVGRSWWHGKPRAEAEGK